jgi:hypothetical protein
MDLKAYRMVDTWAKELDGVFALSDLKVLLSQQPEATLYRTVKDMVRQGALIKVKRGMYATPDAALPVISAKIAPDAYISTGTVLAAKAFIGSVPARKVQAVKIGRPRLYQCALGSIEHLSIDPRLYFGFIPVDGILTATPEKAFLDVCYFYYKGKRFSFDPATDIAVQGFDPGVISEFLKQYDPRFVAFFRTVWRLL